MIEKKVEINMRNTMYKIYNAAYDLFITKGVNNTVIDDIVKKAGVAKGTFYLYFKDKYDLIDKIVLNKSFVVIEEALATADMENDNGNISIQKRVIIFIDYLIEFFKNNKELLAIIYKNLSWGLYKEVLINKEMGDAVQKFILNYKDTEEGIKDAQKILYIIVEMVGSVCYNSIVLEYPYKIDEIKPKLYDSIEKILS